MDKEELIARFESEMAKVKRPGIDKLMHNSTCPFLRPHRKPLCGVLCIQNKVTPPGEFTRFSGGCFFRWKNQGSRGGFESHASKVLLSLRQLGECTAPALLAVTPDHKRFADALNHPRLLPVLPCPIEIDGLALCVYHFHDLYPFTRF